MLRFFVTFTAWNGLYHLIEISCKVGFFNTASQYVVGLVRRTIGILLGVSVAQRDLHSQSAL